MTLKNGFRKFSLLFYHPMDEKIKTWTLCFPAEKNPNMEKALFDWPIVRQYHVKAKYRLISRKFSGFSPERLLNQPKTTHVCIRSINLPIKSLYFRSSVVSVLFASFHFKVIRKSLYHIDKRLIRRMEDAFPPRPLFQARPTHACNAHLTEEIS